MTPLLAQRPSRADRAFERLYKKHVHAVYRYTLAVLHNQADAEDVTQITFLSAYRAIARGERPEIPHNWLIKIAHNACRQRFRDSQRRPQEVAFTVEETHAAPAPDEDVPTAMEIRNALGVLNFNQRAALVMRELEGRSYAEIGEVLDLSVSAIETLLFRARRALREQLEGGLTCEQTTTTLSQLNEGALVSVERGRLRAHLRECKDCAALERRSRAQRAALKHLAAAPLPASLGSFLGTGAAGGGFALGGAGLGVKAAAVLAAGLVSAGVGHEIVDATAGSNKPRKDNGPALLRGRYFSPVSALTGGRAAANPIAERTGASGDLVDTRPEHRGKSRLADSSSRKRLHDGASDGEAAGSPAGAQAPASGPTRARPVGTAVRNLVRTVTVQLPRPPQVPIPQPPPPAVTLPVPVPPVPPVPPLPPVPPVPQPPPPPGLP